MKKNDPEALQQESDEFMNEIKKNSGEFEILPDEMLVNILHNIADNFSHLATLRALSKRFKAVIDDHFINNQNWVMEKLNTYSPKDASNLANIALEIDQENLAKNQNDSYKTTLKYYANSATCYDAITYLFSLPQSQALGFVNFVRKHPLYTKPLLVDEKLENEEENYKFIYQILNVLFSENKIRINSEKLYDITKDINIMNLLHESDLIQKFSVDSPGIIPESCINSLNLTALTLDDELYQTSPKLWRAQIIGQTSEPLSYVNACNAELAQLNLSKLNFSGFNFNQANLERTTLTDSNLQYCNLTDANLKGAKLINADLSNSHLNKVHLDGVYFPHANLTHADLSETSFVGALCLHKNENDIVECDFTINLDHPELPRILKELKETLAKLYPPERTANFLAGGIYKRYENYKSQQKVSIGQNSLFDNTSSNETTQPTSPKTPRAK